jgi:hypothetical protein
MPAMEWNQCRAGTAAAESRRGTTAKLAWPSPNRHPPPIKTPRLNAPIP